MADLSANMKGMSLDDSQHAPNGKQNGYGGPPEGRSAYIPPHARSSGGPRGPPPGPAAFDGAPPANGSWGGPPPAAAYVLPSFPGVKHVF